MAGETVRSEAVCLAIVPWSRTSHIVSWLTPVGKVASVVKGAVRPKSFFLGQYDLNYTCDILYYARGKGDLHALREAFALNRRDFLRNDYLALALAGYFRALAFAVAPAGDDAREFFRLLTVALDSLERPDYLRQLLSFEIGLLDLMGIGPEVDEGKDGEIVLRGERKMPISAGVAAMIASIRRGENCPADENNLDFLLDLSRVIGVYYALHVGLSPEARRSILSMITNKSKVKAK